MSKLIIDSSFTEALDNGFAEAFNNKPERYFSAPGRTEISGNHTDHQHGKVLAAAVDLDTRAAVRINGTHVIRIQSEGYPLCTVDLAQLQPVEAEINTTPALIRGVAAKFAQLGCPVSGFDAYVTSTVLPGSGLSSSAAFEVLVGTIINHLFYDGRVSAPEVAAIGQYAENVFFGKPCGLMDQTVSAVGVFLKLMDGTHHSPITAGLPYGSQICIGFRFRYLSQYFLTKESSNCLHFVRNRCVFVG